MTPSAPLLFHKDVYIPEHARKPIFTGGLTYSNHARNVTTGLAKLPTAFDGSNATLVEAELNPVTGEVEKQVWRMPYDAVDDMCFPLLANGLVKTVWFNARSDTHKTLGRTKYVGGSQWRGMKNKLMQSHTSAA